MSKLGDFMQAAREGELDKMKLMVSDGFDSHQTNDVGRNALYFAASGGQVKVIEWLVVSQGLDVNHRNIFGEGVLHGAVTEGGNNALRWMLEHGATANIGDNFGVSPLQRAARISTEMVDLLLSHGADINHVDDDGLTALHYATVRVVDGYMILHLISQGADVYDNRGEVIFSQVNETNPGLYNMLYDAYALNQLPGYIEPCLHS